jgi:hypothetical protein
MSFLFQSFNLKDCTGIFPIPKTVSSSRREKGVENELVEGLVALELPCFVLPDEEESLFFSLSDFLLLLFCGKKEREEFKLRRSSRDICSQQSLVANKKRLRR